MALDLYASCPCGSGKKFKWCCQPIHVEIDKAFRQEADGQHDAALRTMQDVAEQHPDNPEAWGRLSQLLYRNEKVEEAEAALQKAYAIHPGYAFGHLLQGMFRQSEGELVGALLLFRKAVELYHQDSHDNLAQLHVMIFECEMKMEKPVAARAALEQALRLAPAEEQLQKGMEEIFGAGSRLPEAARRAYSFKSPAASLSANQRGRWDQALASARPGKLGDVERIFAQLSEDAPDNAAAWYNLGLARAWQGNNAGALEALDRYVTLESDEEQAGAAWTLAEVLRFAVDMASQASLHTYSVIYRIQDPEPINQCLQFWGGQRRLLVLQQPKEDEPIFSALVLEQTTSLTANPADAPLPRLGAYLVIVSDRIRLWHTSKERLERTRTELEEKAGNAVVRENMGQGSAGFGDVLAEALVFPVGIADQATAEKRVREQMQQYFEDKWIHVPQPALAGVPAVDAAGSPVLRKKLRGLIQFVEECAAMNTTPYDFNRLRRKLGLLAADGSAAAPVAAAGPDIGALSSAELAGLAPESLSDDQAELAFQSALKLDAQELAGRFAENLLARPTNPERPDRFTPGMHLVQLALKEGKTDRALECVDAGEKADCEHNQGRRRNDWELKRAQIHARRGEADRAQELFASLIERAPGELRYRGSAAEAMLSARKGPQALQFAEAGLAKAREQNNRDSEQYFLELAAAARKQG